MKKIYKILKEKCRKIKGFFADICFEIQYRTAKEYTLNEWIEKKVDINIIEDLFRKSLEKIEDYVILDGLLVEHNEAKTGYLEQSDYLNSIFFGSYIIEKKDGTLLLKGVWEFEVEFGVEIEKSIEKRFNNKNQFEINPRLEMDFFYNLDCDFDQDYIYRYYYPIFLVKYEIKIESYRVKDYKVTRIDWI